MKHGKIIALVLLVLSLGGLIFLRLSDKTSQNIEKTVSSVSAEPTEAPEIQIAPEELTAVLSADELEKLDASALKRLDLTGSTCYEAIEAFKTAHPGVKVIYSVLIEGDSQALELDPNVGTLTLDDASFFPSLTENAKWLPALKSLSIAPDSADSALVDAFREAKPDCEIHYEASLLGTLYPYDTEEITITGLNAEKSDELLTDLQKFTHLSVLNIPQEENDLSLDEAIRLSEQCPLLSMDYQMELFGQTVSLDAERLEYENTDIGKEGLEELRALLPCFKNLRYLKLDDCGIDNETMERLRDDFPDIKVVWRVYFGSYHCLTDTEMIWATGGSVNDISSVVLKYCTDVKYLDLGHSLITQVDFLNYMPKLEVAILAISWVSSIEPIANCPNLEYLELFSTRVTDLSPLAKCTHLQHLNVSHCVNTENVTIGPTDISCLYDLPELKRFYCTMSYVPEEQQQEMIERHPDCECEFRWIDPAEGAWRFDENGDRNERYALLCEQFGYDTYQQSGKTWSLYG